MTDQGFTEVRSLLAAVEVDRSIDSACNLAEWARTELGPLLDELERLRSGGEYLGQIIHRLNQTALDATGLHHLIDETGDGDWQAVWENVADLGANLVQLRKDRADELAAIAGKQQRDAARIAYLECVHDRAYGKADEWASSALPLVPVFGHELRTTLDGAV
ncbi:hypothetical protein [Nocardia brasiliensis]|uniref:hypothetical protein n=1 Tax=Nocardia brasiliensis TaxID=37326 RepID=UPI002458EF5D|nr:hypothetical protein [Nocardia brasiliensis]